MLESIGDRIKIAIKNSGVTQAEVAKQCNVSKQAITGWTKNSSIDKKHLMQVSKITGADFSWLLEGKSTDKTKPHGVNEERAEYSKEDVELLKKINQLSDLDRARLPGIIDALNPQLGKKTGS